ncbi:MAG TPA: hypothetical protein VGI39_28735 [Polyangiaceae bacterium]|jgi:hypothetical protein
MAASLVATEAFAQGEGLPEKEGKPPIALGLEPGTPQVGTLPGGLTPAYGQTAADEKDWRFDFHGFLTMPLRAGINKRAGTVTTEQQNVVLHAPPMVPDYIDSFNYTTVVPQPYVQLNFSYGNSVVTGNVIILARTAATAASFLDPPAESGISDAFLNFRVPNLGSRAHLEMNVGVFTNRYGIMGEYDEGRYGTPVIARTKGAGENIVARFALQKLTLDLEQGIQGQLDKPPNGILASGWNDFADQSQGTGFVNHLHAGAGYAGMATLGLHYVQAWTQDDRASQGRLPDGSIRVLGADLRFTLGPYGHLYLVVSDAHAFNAHSVGGIIQVLNAPGGDGLMQNYFGPNSGGTGSLLTFAGQYDLSIGKLLRGGAEFKGDSPDLVVSLFGMQTHVSSAEKDFDNVTKRKFGAEGGYSMLSWLAASLRLDHVETNTSDSRDDFSIVSPRLIFRSKWQAHDQVVLQYSHFFNGSQVHVRTGYPAVEDPTIHPDADVVSLAASMWW